VCKYKYRILIYYILSTISYITGVKICDIAVIRGVDTPEPDFGISVNINIFSVIEDFRHQWCNLTCIHNLDT